MPLCYILASSALRLASWPFCRSSRARPPPRPCRSCPNRMLHAHLALERVHPFRFLVPLDHSAIDNPRLVYEHGVTVTRGHQSPRLSWAGDSLSESSWRTLPAPRKRGQEAGSDESDGPVLSPMVDLACRRADTMHHAIRGASVANPASGRFTMQPRRDFVAAVVVPRASHSHVVVRCYIHVAPTTHRPSLAILMAVVQLDSTPPALTVIVEPWIEARSEPQPPTHHTVLLML